MRKMPKNFLLEETGMDEEFHLFSTFGGKEFETFCYLINSGGQGPRHKVRRGGISKVLRPSKGTTEVHIWLRHFTLQHNIIQYFPTKLFLLSPSPSGSKTPVHNIMSNFLPKLQLPPPPVLMRCGCFGSQILFFSASD